MKKSISTLLLLFLFAAFTFSQTAATSTALPANVSEAKLESKLMGHAMPYRVILPTGYAQDKTKRFPVVYVLHGLTGAYTNWTTAPYGKLDQTAKGLEVIFVTPEGANGWYTDSPTIANAKYESYIIKELIPEIDTKYRTIADSKGRAIAGLSMGGYGALKFGLKYPNLFFIVGSFSGAIFAPSYIPGSLTVPGQSAESPFITILNKSVSEAYGPAGSATRKENDVFEIVRSLNADGIKSLPFIYLDCGTEDFLIQSNRDFAALLLERKIPHEFRQLPGGHTWPYWNLQVVEFLRLGERLMK